MDLMPANQREGGLGRDQGAVSSVVGTVLMLSVTITVFAGLSVGVLAYFDAQDEAPRSDVAAASRDGTYLLVHSGGDPIQLDEATVWATVNGLEHEVPLTAFASQVADGNTWRIGESLCVAGDAAPCHFVGQEVDGSYLIIANTVMAQQGERGIPLTCPSDTDGPTVSGWLQVPADLDTHSSGSVVLTATATDACPGVDDDTVPNLRWRLNDGSNPAYSSLAMTLAAAGTWTATVPSQDWDDLGGSSLEYYAEGLEDLLGNSADSAPESDLVTELAVITYVGGATASTGTVTSLANAQSASDGGAEATIAEGATGTSGTSQYAAASHDSGWGSSSGNAFASDNAYASTASNSAQTVKFGLADPGGSPGLIQSVVLKAEVQITTWSNDGFRFQGCLASTCSQSALLTPGSSNEATLSFDISSLRPGGGSWSWTDITNLDFAITNERQSGRDGTFRVDHAYAEVTYAATYSADVELTWSGVPVGATYNLQLRHRVAGDTFSLQVWDGSSWTTRASLTSGTLTTTEHTLTSAEYNGGAPRIRIVDATAQGTSQGTVWVAFARVVTP